MMKTQWKLMIEKIKDAAHSGEIPRVLDLVQKLEAHLESHSKFNPEYASWNAMRFRCQDEGHKSYARYGGRGITVCERWRNSFEAFLADMGRRPGSDYSLDRIDNKGDYEPSNCRWATRTEQNRNRDGNIRIEFRGEIRTLKEWSEVTGLPYEAIKSRRRKGWPIEKMLTCPVRRWLKQNEKPGVK